MLLTPLLLRISLVGCCGLTAAALIAAEPTSRPNILFAFADDWGRQASAYRDVDTVPGDFLCDVVQTPNFDEIARRGVLYTNAFVNAPSCTPCRSSLLSGQHFWRTGRGAILRGAVWDPAIPSYPLLLQDSDYHIGQTYKVWAPGTPNDAPYGGGANQYESAGGAINSFSQNATKALDEQTFEQIRDQLLDQVRQNFRQFLADRDPDQPFCYWYGPTNVHRQWTAGSGTRLWGIDPDTLSGKLPAFLPDVEIVRQDLVDYLGEVQAFDAAVGVLWEELQESGLADDTVIAISGDHGPAGFPHGKCNLYQFGSAVALAIAGPNIPGGRVVDDLVSLPDLAPTFLELGGVEIPDVMTARSLIPSLHSDRSGLVDADRDDVLIGRERHVEMAREGYLPYPQRAIRTAEHLFIINFKPDRYPLGDPYNLSGDEPPTEKELSRSTFVTHPDEDAGPTKAFIVLNRDDPKYETYYDHAYGKRPREELYEMASDPDQMNNLADDPRYADVAGELRNRLMTALRKTGDPRVIDDGRYFETPPLAGPIPSELNPPKRGRIPKSKR